MEAAQRAELAPSVRIYTIAELSRVTVPAAVAGVPGSFGPKTFIFPVERMITGLLVIPVITSIFGFPTTAPEAAKLSLEVMDENGEPLFSDQIGDTRQNRLPFGMPCDALFGPGYRPFPLKRLVEPSDRWVFTFRNPTGESVGVAGVALFHEGIKR